MPYEFGDADAFAIDGLDQLLDAGITNNATFLLKSGKGRIPGTALRDALLAKVE